MLLKPIHILPIEVKINADRRLVFQFITNFGKTAPESGASSRVLSREENGLLVEFETEVSVLFYVATPRLDFIREIERTFLQRPLTARL